MKPDVLAQACEIVRAKSGAPKPHVCKPKPWWLPRRFAKCSCAILKNFIAPVILNGSLTVARFSEGRVLVKCCWRHGRA